jgi:hypothetical protein
MQNIILLLKVGLTDDKVKNARFAVMVRFTRVSTLFFAYR